MKKVIIVLFAWIFFSSLISNEKYGNLEIVIENIKNSKGKIKTSLFNSKDGFPNKPENNYQEKDIQAEKGKVSLTYEQLPYGEYAVSLWHDEDNDNEFDMFLFVPKEGWGASNNPKARMGPPKYEEARFSINQSSIMIKIRVNY